MIGKYLLKSLIFTDGGSTPVIKLVEWEKSDTDYAKLFKES
jgi:hypothetical protein